MITRIKNYHEIEKEELNKKNKIDHNMKVILKKIETEKEKKNKKLDQTKHLGILLLEIKYSNNPYKLQSALKELNKIQVINKNLHEIEQKILVDYNGEFKRVVYLKVGDQIRQTDVKFRNMVDFESYNNAIDEGYDAEDAIFNGYVCKSITPQFTLNNRSKFGNGSSFDQQINEYRAKN